MNGAILLAAMVGAGLLPVLVYGHVVEARRRACDGCRLESLGSSMPYAEHTCSKRRARYRDRKGRAYAFGRRAWTQGGD